MHHKRGQDRQQTNLLPESLDDFVAPDSLVRVIDVWVGHLDMAQLGFGHAQLKARGAPPYDPADLLKLYLWGYLNAVRSSRSLEKETHRNTECMWLLGRLTPDHKTIAQFRRNNMQALVAMCACFVEFAREQGLIGGRTVAIDGSKLRAVSSRKAVLSKKKLIERARKNAQQIAQYMAMLDEQDENEGSQEGRPQQVKAALQRLQAEGVQIEQQLQQLQEAGVETLVQTEPDAQAMKSLQSAPGYNLQTAVEVDSHLIVHHEVTAAANDLHQLQPMAEGASRALGGPCTAVADAGYANGAMLAAVQQQGISTYVADNRGVNNKGLMDRSAFSYDARQDCYTCPQGNTLRRRRVLPLTQQIVYQAKREDCGACPMKAGCTAAPQRSVTRHLHEAALQANSQRMRQQPQMMKVRRCVAEHPFADLKHRILGNARLLMRGMAGATAELSIAVQVYNLKRVFNLKGAAWMREALQG